MRKPSNLPCVNTVLGHCASDITPDTLVLVVDVSGSMNRKDWSLSRLHGAKAACQALLERKHTLRPRDRVGLVTFGDEGKVRMAPTQVATGRKEISTAIKALKTGGGTEMSAGLKTAGRLLGSTFSPKDSFWTDPIAWLLSPFITRDNASPGPESRGDNRRIILLTDGHNTGGTPPVRIAEQLKDSGIAIDCIGIGGSPGDVDEKELKAIASLDDNGKPRYWFIGQPAELIQTFKSLATSIRGIR